MEPALKEEFIDNNQDLELARLLVNSLEQGNEQESTEILSQLLARQEEGLFKQVGQLTRQLHDALGNFAIGEQVTHIVNSDEIGNARERLSYVIEKTSDSAHRTLEAVEQMQPLTENLRDSSEQMIEEWDRFKRREMDAQDFREMAKHISDFLEKTRSDSTSICSSLSDVMLAQDYQDLTGQIIRQVIDVVSDVEDSLVQIVRCRGAGVCEAPVLEEEQGKDIKAEGPQVNQESNNNVMSSQDDVDDLLSSLGF